MMFLRRVIGVAKLDRVRNEEIPWTGSGGGYGEREEKKVDRENGRNEWGQTGKASVRRRSERYQTQMKTTKVLE